MKSLSWLHKEQIWLSVKLSCGMIFSHWARVKVGLKASRVAMKWFFHVWIAPSDALQRWLCGGMRCKLTELLWNEYFRSSEHSFSKTCNLGA